MEPTSRHIIRRDVITSTRFPFGCQKLFRVRAQGRHCLLWFKLTVFNYLLGPRLLNSYHQRRR